MFAKKLLNYDKISISNLVMSLKEKLHVNFNFYKIFINSDYHFIIVGTHQIAQ